MDVLFKETYDNLPRDYKKKTPRGFPYSDILYADDTLLMGRSAKHLATLLHTLQKTAIEYGMHLNKSKTVHIPINVQDVITFFTGEPMAKELDTMYLGTKFAAFPDPHLELTYRLQSSLLTWRRLFCFGNIPRYRKD